MSLSLLKKVRDGLVGKIAGYPLRLVGQDVAVVGALRIMAGTMNEVIKEAEGIKQTATIPELLTAYAPEVEVDYAAELPTACATVRVQAQAIEELDAANKAQAAILKDHAQLILTLKTEVGHWKLHEALARKSYNELLEQIQTLMATMPPAATHGLGLLAPGTDGVTIKAKGLTPHA